MSDNTKIGLSNLTSVLNPAAKMLVDATNKAASFEVAAKGEDVSTQIRIKDYPETIPEAHISAEAYNSFKDSFGNVNNVDFFKKLAKSMNHLREKEYKPIDGLSTKIEGELADNLSRMHALIDFARRGTQQQLATGERGGQDENTMRQRLHALEEMNKMAMGLESLARNEVLYSKEYRKQQLQKLEELIKSVADEDAAINIRLAQYAAMRGMAYGENFKRHFYNLDKYGVTQFSAIDAGIFKTKHTKHNHGKVFHDDKGHVIIKAGIPSRKNLYNIGHGVSLETLYALGQDESSKLAQLHSDTAYNVDTLIGEYNKGSKSNPLNLTYVWTDGSKEPEPPKQPVEGLQILLEYKRRAILEGKTFYANRDGKPPIEITPSPEFTETEKTLFNSYAKERGTAYKKILGLFGKEDVVTSTKTAGQILFGSSQLDFKMVGKKLGDMVGASKLAIENKDNNVAKYLPEVQKNNTLVRVRYKN